MMVFGSGHHPPSSGMEHTDSKTVRASKAQDMQHSMGLGDDVLYIAGMLGRAITWPLRAALRMVRRS